MAIPLLVLYEISIIIAKIFGKNRENPEEDTADKPETSDEQTPEE